MLGDAGACRARIGTFLDHAVKTLGIGTAAFIWVFALPATAASPTLISFELFPEFYSVARHHDPNIKGHNGFWFRRINITFDNALSSSLSFRFKLEMSSSGDFKTSSLLVPFVKDAFLDYRLKGQDIQVGIISTPTWENVESFWGYRALEKTPCDLQKFGSARDFGVALKGGLNSAGTVSYKLMFGNGEGNNAEVNKGKKAYAQVIVRPWKGFHLDLYADTERQKDSRTYRLLQVFTGYEGRWGKVGFLYARRETALSEARGHASLWSTLAVLRARAGAEVVLRFDRMPAPNPLGPGISYIPFSDRAPSNLVIAGVGWRVSESIQIIPNIKYVFYDRLEGVSGPGPDMYLNLSVRLKF
jgi:hypothetical protein